MQAIKSINAIAKTTVRSVGRSCAANNAFYSDLASGQNKMLALTGATLNAMGYTYSTLLVVKPTKKNLKNVLTISALQLGYLGVSFINNPEHFKKCLGGFNESLLDNQLKVIKELEEVL